MYSTKDLKNPELINEITEAINGKALGCPKGLGRGEWLSKELGLDKVKTIRRKNSGHVSFFDDEDMRRKSLNNAYKDAANKNWSLVDEEFTIDENFNFTHTSWKGVFVQGGTTVITTMEIINRYIEECNKPYGQRDLSFIHLVKD